MRRDDPHDTAGGARSHLGALVVLNVAALLVMAHFLNDALGEWGGDNVRFLLLAEALASGRGLVDLALPGLPPDVRCPPLYPLLLAPWVWAGAPLVVLKGFTAALGLAGLNVGYALLSRWHDRGTALLVMISTLCCGVFLDSGLSIMSESPFFLFATATILLVQRSFDAAERRLGLCIAAGAMMGVSVLTRAAGVAIAPATILFAWFLRGSAMPLGERLRRLAIVGAAAAALAGPWMAWGLVAGAGPTGGYFREFEQGDTIRAKIRVRAEEAPAERSLAGRILARPLDNAWDLGTRLRSTPVPEFVEAMGPRWTTAVRVGFLAVCALLAGLSLLGLALGLRSRRRAHDVYVLAYFGVLSVWVGGGFRLLMPLLPFLLASIYEGVVVAAGAGSRARRLGRLVLVVSIAANLAITTQFPLIRDRLAGDYDPWWGSLLRASCRLGEIARPGETVIAAPDNVVFYLAGLQAVRIPLRGDPETVLDRILASEADYVVVTPFERWRYKKIHLAVRDHPERFPITLTENEVHVHRILKDQEAAGAGLEVARPRPSGASARCRSVRR